MTQTAAKLHINTTGNKVAGQYSTESSCEGWNGGGASNQQTSYINVLQLDSFTHCGYFII